MLRKTLVTLTLAAVMAGVFNTAWAGTASGEHIAYTTVHAFSTDRFKAIRFLGGEEAAVMVAGDGRTDLDLFVYDENGLLVAKDDDGSDWCIAYWTPKTAGLFYIVVDNLGAADNHYMLHTN